MIKTCKNIVKNSIDKDKWYLIFPGVGYVTASDMCVTMETHLHTLRGTMEGLGGHVLLRDGKLATNTCNTTEDTERGELSRHEQNTELSRSLTW